MTEDNLTRYNEHGEEHLKWVDGEVQVGVKIKEKR